MFCRKHLNTQQTLSIEVRKSFAVGHLAFGYIISRSSAHFTRVDLNVPVVFALSILPDLDIVLPFFSHRGATHSFFSALFIFTPFFILNFRRAIPYFLASIQHSMLGDFLTGGKIQLLWPFTTEYYGFEGGITSNANIVVEWIAFLISVIVLVKKEDVKNFFRSEVSNLVLVIPLSTLLIPTFLNFPLSVPQSLAIPHLILIIIFSVSIVNELSKLLVERVWSVPDL